MTTPTGTISLNDVNVELGLSGTTTISLNQTNVRTLAGVASGAISMNDLRGKSNRVTLSYTFSANTANASLNISGLSGYVAGNSDITVTVNSGIYLYATSTANAGLTLTGGTTGDTLTIVNNGYIMGMGGKGGGVTFNGSAYTHNYLQSAGSNAINLGFSCTIQNNSYIGGGGGGGGSSPGLYGTGSLAAGGGAGGGAGGDFNNNGTVTTGGAGGGVGSSGSNASTVNVGGGGGRIMPGTNITQTATGGTPSSSASSIGGGAGNAGSTSSSGTSTSGGVVQSLGLGGSGGGTGSVIAGYAYGNYKLAGGGGGGYGAAGGASLNGNAGAAGGKCVNLNGFTATWTATGTRYGAIA